MKTIGIIGSGSWGTALGILLSGNAARVRLWGREPEVATAVNQRRENPRYLPGLPLPPNLQATTELDDLLDCEAILLVSEEELEFLRPGQHVDLYPTSLPAEKLVAQIEHLSQQELQAAPASLSLKAGGNLATRTDEQGVERPVEVTYQASAPVDDDAGRLLAGTTGQAKIHAGYQPLATRLWRGLCRTFRFEL